MCNPKNKQLVEHRGLKWYDEHNTVQTRGSYLYDFDKDSGYLYRSTLNHSTLAITERRPFLYLARGLGFQHDDVFISGDDYVYYGKPDSYEGKIRWYRRDMSTGKITTLIYENATDAKSVIIPEPCANSLWRFGLEWVNAGPDCLDYIRLSEL